MTIYDVRDAMLRVSENVGHYIAFKKIPPYIVWAEDGQADAIWADGKLVEQVVTGTVDLFTKTEHDPLVGRIQAELTAAEIPWSLNSVQYEQDTGMIHYEWIWEADCGEDYGQGV